MYDLTAVDDALFPAESALGSGKQKYVIKNYVKHRFWGLTSLESVLYYIQK